MGVAYNKLKEYQEAIDAYKEAICFIFLICLFKLINKTIKIWLLQIKFIFYKHH
jgi:tetratricopeptide (TPR) repeat protein